MVQHPGEYPQEHVLRAWISSLLLIRGNTSNRLLGTASVMTHQIYDRDVEC